VWIQLLLLFVVVHRNVVTNAIQIGEIFGKSMAATCSSVLTCRAAVAWEAGKPLCLEEIQVDPPKKGEARGSR